MRRTRRPAYRGRVDHDRLRRLRIALTGLVVIGLGAFVVAVFAPGSGPADAAAGSAAPPTTAAPTTGDDVTGPTLAFLGDSITEGIGAGPQEGYAWVAAAELGWPLALVDGIAGSGYLTPGYARPMPDRVADVVAAAPDVVVVAGGTNDARAGYGPDEVGPVATALLADLRAGLPDAVIVVMSTFPTSVSAAVTGETAVDAALREAATSVDAAYVDAHVLIAEAVEDPAEWQGYISGDGLHPNADGYRVLGEAVAAELGQIVAARV